MHGKRLLTLVVFLIVLIAAVIVFKRQPAPTRLADEVGFERLVPSSLTAEAIQGLDLYQGDKTDEAIRLRRRDDAWVASSYHDAPVKADKVTKLLDTVGSLEGDLRSEQKDFLGDFQLEDGQALHLLLYTADMDKPAAHLLAGKSSGRTGFMRTADNARVLSVNLNLQSEAGLYGDDTEKKPEAKPWLNLQLHDIPQDQVTAVELHQSNRRFHLTQQKPEAPDSESPPADDQKAAPKPDAAPKAKPEWVLAEPNVTYDLKQGVVDGLVSTLRTLRGDDVVAPDKVADYGLETPSHRAVLTVQEAEKEARQVTIAVGKEVPEQEGKRYVRLEQEGPVYVLPKWSFKQIFPTLGTLLSLDVLRVPLEEVARIAWTQEGQAWTLERQAEAAKRPAGDTAETKPEPAKPVWRLLQAVDVSVDSDKVTSLLNLTKALTADDWFDKVSGATGLEDPVVSLVLTRADQTRHQVVIGQTYGEDDNRYVGLEGAAGTFVISKTSYESLIEALKGLRPDAAAATEPSADGKAASSTASGSGSDAGVPGVPSSTSASQ
ncbi:MAG: DUF4340 domain-containing protein [Candidatus Tectomicrobia bacterium]|nr:DUF4340 domain-containing protein [Candidatus Tectomicrobia bacterium]